MVFLGVQGRRYERSLSIHGILSARSAFPVIFSQSITLAFSLRETIQIQIQSLHSTLSSGSPGNSQQFLLVQKDSSLILGTKERRWLPPTLKYHCGAILYSHLERGRMADLQRSLVYSNSKIPLGRHCEGPLLPRPCYSWIMCVSGGLAVLT